MAVENDTHTERKGGTRRVSALMNLIHNQFFPLTSSSSNVPNSAAPLHPEFVTSNHSVKSKQVTFLPHVEGLRGIAVLAALFYHFDISFAKGGYVGVDVFFTLSGFLITSNILQTNCTHKDLGRFFKKRFFRLYPASLTTVIVSLIGAYLTFPDDLANRVSKSAIFSQLLSSNIYFHSNTNYFDERAKVKPLLHLWSLSLEEQFYLVWAPFVTMVAKKNGNSSWQLLLFSFIAIISFGHAIQHQNTHPSYVFFELPPRLYQFAIGAIASLVSANSNKWYQNFVSIEDRTSSRIFSKSTHPPSTKPSRKFDSTYWPPTIFTAGIPSMFSAILLGLSFYSLPEGAPPFWILPVALSSAIIIASPEHTFVSKVLSLKPIRFIGRISYSTYLIHWPLQVFSSRILSAIGKQRLNACYLTLTSIVIGYFLFLYVETPFRSPKLPRRAMLITLMLAGAFSLSVKGMVSEGFSDRESSLYRVKFKKGWTQNRKPCILKNKFRSSRGQHGTEVTEILCGRLGMKQMVERINGSFPGDNELGHDVVLFGNSYVRMWAYALGFIGHERGVTFRLFHLPGCPFVGPNEVKQLEPNCHYGVNLMWSKVRTLRKGTFVGLSFPFLKQQSHSPWFDSVLTELKNNGLRPFVISIPPGLNEEIVSKFACIDLSRMWIRKLLLLISHVGSPHDCIRDIVKTGSKTRSTHGRLNSYILSKALCKEHNIPYIDVFAHLCNFNPNVSDTSLLDLGNLKCTVPANFSYGYYDVGYQRDLHHISPFGSFSLRLFLAESLVEIGALRRIQDN